MRTLWRGLLAFLEMIGKTFEQTWDSLEEIDRTGTKDRGPWYPVKDPPLPMTPVELRLAGLCLVFIAFGIVSTVFMMVLKASGS